MPIHLSGTTVPQILGSSSAIQDFQDFAFKILRGGSGDPPRKANGDPALSY
jgi:hypothetical protein